VDPHVHVKFELPKVMTLNKTKGCLREWNTCYLVSDIALEINQIKQETEVIINNTIDIINELIPERNVFVTKCRTKRALLPFIGDLLKIIFGTATY
jgi:hypothetical protein